ncbi:hypothetical protein C8N29_1187 [Agitococcus lubricus]|uniref:CdiA C-terminal tRNase domain-containing protein n=1 Tax=Agitococcus lubricus TaxID=1077255 RepID=A0A2T5IUF2_9GAMM|nr:hypothetical protein C8N29_1187 [Agitococcus lubricus]
MDDNINRLNQFYEKNMTVLNPKSNVIEGIEQIKEHVQKSDFVPVDFRILNSKNQQIFMNFVKTLPKSAQEKFIIMR